VTHILDEAALGEWLSSVDIIQFDKTSKLRKRFLRSSRTILRLLIGRWTPRPVNSSILSWCKPLFSPPRMSLTIWPSLFNPQLETISI